MKKCLTILLLLLLAVSSWASYLLIPMDEPQRNHLKAYGVAYWALQREVEVTWLLNYRGGAFMMKYADALEKECRLRGISYEVIADGQSADILSYIDLPFQWWLEGGQSTQKSGFPHPVRSYEAGHFRTMQRGIDSRCHNFMVFLCGISYCQVLKSYGLHADRNFHLSR